MEFVLPYLIYFVHTFKIFYHILRDSLMYYTKRINLQFINVLFMFPS